MPTSLYNSRSRRVSQTECGVAFAAIWIISPLIAQLGHSPQRSRVQLDGDIQL